MYISYFDESGDDGFPTYSSPLFVLTSVYFDHKNWHKNYEKCVEFRKNIKKNYGFPVKFEIHTREILLNKKPYSALMLDDVKRISLLEDHIRFIASMDLQVINTAINKTLIQNPDYQVLDKALTYSIQRIENTLNTFVAKPYFMLITDSGRVAKMRATTRRIQKFNPIKSNFGGNYQKLITKMIEDPLPKDSKESVFIQMADSISTVIYDYLILTKGIGSLPRRIPPAYDITKIIDFINILKPVLNLKATKYDPYGIVCYPLK